MGNTVLVALTSDQWFEHFRPSDVLTRVPSANFWQPAATNRVRAIGVGDYFFFRLKHPRSAVVGFGLFVGQEFLTVQQMWERFGTGNGAGTRDQLEVQLGMMLEDRGYSPSEAKDRAFSCLLLEDLVFLPNRRWLPWGSDEGWSPNTQMYKRFDLTEGSGKSLARLVESIL